MKYKQYRQPTRCNNNGFSRQLNIFWAFICPSSGALDCVVQLAV